MISAQECTSRTELVYKGELLWQAVPIGLDLEISYGFISNLIYEI